ncbi:MAG TPA: oligosaccharide flippase family protein [bacterium]|nr:oligosaccharide flippase family protein [bacterium]
MPHAFLTNIKERFNALLSSPTRRRLASGAFWGGVAAAGARFVTVITSFFLARILGQIGFGEYGMITSTAIMVGSFAGMGIGLTVTKHVAEFKSKDPDRVGRLLALSSIVTMASALIYGVAFVALAPWLAERTLAAPHLAPMLRISAISVAFSVVNGVQVSSLAGVEAFRAKSHIMVGTGLLQTVLVVIGAWLWGLEGAVWAMAVGMLLTVIVTRWVVSREWHRRNIRLLWREARREWRILLDFSLPAFLNSLLIGPVYWACNAFLANEPNGYAELGIFNAAAQWQGAILFLPWLFITAMIPVISEKYGDGDVTGSLKVMADMMKLIVWAVVPIAAVLSLSSPWVMSGYGDTFTAGYWTMVLLVATGVFNGIEAPIQHFAVASGQVWARLALYGLWAAVLLAASWFMVKWGAEGLAGARLFSAVFHFVLFYLFIVTHQKKVTSC